MLVYGIHDIMKISEKYKGRGGMSIGGLNKNARTYGSLERLEMKRQEKVDQIGAFLSIMEKNGPAEAITSEVLHEIKEFRARLALMSSHQDGKFIYQ